MALQTSEEEFTPDQKIAINGMFRKRITEEDTLINQRTSWMIFSESLLIAAWAATVTKIPEIIPRLPPGATREDIRTILVGIPVFGLAVAIISLIGVSAAYMEIHAMQSMYKVKFPTIESDHRLPKLVGSGPAHLLGHLVPWVLPIAFAWLQYWMLLYSWHARL